MKKFIVCSVLGLAGGMLLVAQTEEKNRSKPNHDELVAYLKLSDTQVACLESNRDKFREAVAPSFDQLRELQKQLRQAARDGTDATAIKAQGEDVRASIQKTRSSYVTTAQTCVGGAAAVKDLVAAETLMNEVRQGIGLLLLEATEERSGGVPGPAMRGRGPRGQ